MKYRKMGKKINWDVSALGFGAMRLPTVGTEEIDEKKKLVDEKQSIDMIRYAIDNGVNYVDTAWMYMDGKSEELLGKALKDGYRSKVHLVTKLPIGQGFIKKEEDFDRIFKAQLDRLQEDYLDLYDIEKERYAKKMATEYGKYLTEMLALKWDVLSYDEWKKSLKKEDE